MRRWLLMVPALLLGLASFLPLQAHAGPPEAAAPRLLRRTQHFEVYLAAGSLRRPEALRLVERLEPTLAAVAQRFGTPFTARERIELLPPQRGVCAVRGLTFSQKRQIRLFYGPGTDVDRLQAILAHELVHQLQRERFGDRVQQAADVILLEGWATLAGDDFARTPDGAEPRWRARLREVVARGELLPLAVDLDRDCRTTTRNSIYDEWASFVDFLERQYGAEKLAAVYRSSAGRKAGTADYAAVYGTSFGELEAAWRAWVVSQ
ncbi:MAG TPA: hypothetical protein VEZ12_15405 [Herpetosiphonaceae bacterium]|nr:hypothetical protein [Herpetosiphonaceae bacterium]